MKPGERRLKKVLMIVRAFPPFQSAGHSIRVVKFLKYLPALGWLPSVLTIDDRREYEFDRKQGSEALLSEIPQEVSIYRTFAGEPSWEFLEKERTFGQRNWLTKVIVKVLGGARRWAFRNILVPDRCVVWLPFALEQGRRIVRSEGIDVIFATCPPHSATLIGALLKLLTGKRLILDFRDDWVDTPFYHSKPAIIRLINRRLESWVLRMADKVVLVTEGSRKAFIQRHPTQPIEKFAFISNGCDLEDFAALNALPTALPNSKFTIVHAGAMNDSKYWGRNPRGLFEAIQNLMRQEPELCEQLTLVFAGDLPEVQQRLANAMGLSGMIKHIGHLPHDQVLPLVKSADLLLAINYENWSTIIPAKIYEYWAAGGSPILLLSCPGAAADLVEEHNLGVTVDPYDSDGICGAILSAYRQSKTAAPPRVSTDGIESYDRQALTRKLAQVLSMTCES
jgi:glycosyltransferase involved in cell wall biosynthesis